ncbi:hypothetical protein PI124_g21051 [Phytophthora idaei]|nr:hypothetical protein PI124_g21051 [Phytophthora idaei]
MVEATRNTNDVRFKLFSCMIHDDFRHAGGVRVACADGKSMLGVLDGCCHFIQAVQVFIANEDCDEIALLREIFPGATILLCVFHVVKYLRREMAKSDYGVFDREKVEDAFRMMVNASTED